MVGTFVADQAIAKIGADDVLEIAQYVAVGIIPASLPRLQVDPDRSIVAAIIDRVDDAFAAVEFVGARSAIDHVVAAAAKDDVGPLAAAQDVDAVAAIKAIAKVGSGDIFDRYETIAFGIVPSTDPGGKIDPYCSEITRIIGGIDVGASLDPVSTRPARDNIVSAERLNPVHLARAHQPVISFGTDNIRNIGVDQCETIRITVAGGLCVADLEGALCRPIGAPQLFTVHGVGEGEVDDTIFAAPLDQSRAAGAWRQVGHHEGALTRPVGAPQFLPFSAVVVGEDDPVARADQIRNRTGDSGNLGRPRSSPVADPKARALKGFGLQEEKLVASYRQVGRSYIARLVGRDILDHHRPGVGPVALPQLAPVHPIVGGEIQRIAYSPQLRRIGIGQIHIAAARLESGPDILHTKDRGAIGCKKFAVVPLRIGYRA